MRVIKVMAMITLLSKSVLGGQHIQIGDVLPGGATSYVQNSSTLQSGASYSIQNGTLNDSAVATALSVTEATPGGFTSRGINLSASCPSSSPNTLRGVDMNMSGTCSSNATGWNLSDTVIAPNNVGLQLSLTGTGASNTGIFNTVTGAGTTNVGASFSAANATNNTGLSVSGAGGTNNYGLKVVNGQVQINSSVTINSAMVVNGDTTRVYVIAVSTSIGGPYILTISTMGHVSGSGTGTPSISSCGSSPSIVGTDWHGTATIGSGVVTSCTITFNQPFNGNPDCIAVPDSSTVGGGVTSQTNSGFVAGFSATLGGGKFTYHCFGGD